MSEKLRILFVTPEAHPLVKTGGLGDVGGALPSALGEIGVDVRLLLPAYPGLIEQLSAQPLGTPLRVLSGMMPVQMFHGLMPNGRTPVYLIDAPALYHRSGLYLDENGKDWPDNAFRFGLLSRTAAMFGIADSPFGWQPQLIHCNDWQTGLTPAYLAYAADARARSLISLHNMAFQGIFPPHWLSQLALPRSSFDVEGVEFHGQLSFLKAGIYYADHITAVSPTYVKEIQTAEFGCGLEGLLSRRKDRLTGILNGVDSADWDPTNDPYLEATYSSGKLQGKAANKRALQEQFSLNVDSEIPLLGVVSRLSRQKGIDLILAIAEELLVQPVQLVVLGSGDASFETELKQLKQEWPKAVGVYLGYNEKLAHLVEAGADIFLMPSRFEPCGLNQMYSMLYGTPPVVRRTGGLADSVIDATPQNLATGAATGFVFTGDNEAELLACVLRALILFPHKTAWRKLQISGMQQDFGWQRSAQQYLSLYRSLIIEG